MPFMLMLLPLLRAGVVLLLFAVAVGIGIGIGIVVVVSVAVSGGATALIPSRLKTVRGRFVPGLSLRGGGRRRGCCGRGCGGIV